MKYRYLSNRGALNDATGQTETASPLVERVPAAVAREHVVFPLSEEGATVTLASATPNDVMLADKLRFILNRNVRLVAQRREVILALIDQHYGRMEPHFTES